MARRSKECQLLDNSHGLAESDLVDEEEEEGESVYLMLNLDGSLPFPGTVVKIFPVFVCFQFGKQFTSRLKKRRYRTTIFLQLFLTLIENGASPSRFGQQFIMTPSSSF